MNFGTEVWFMQLFSIMVFFIESKESFHGRNNVLFDSDEGMSHVHNVQSSKNQVFCLISDDIQQTWRTHV